MQHDKVVVYLHLVWTTWDRTPFIEPEKERALHDCLAAIANENKCRVIAINGMPDHVHLLLAAHSDTALSELMQQLKGTSSRLAKTQLGLSESFRWRGSYAAFSVSRWDLRKIANYIRRQKEHHQKGTFIPQLEPDD